MKQVKRYEWQKKDSTKKLAEEDDATILRMWESVAEAHKRIGAIDINRIEDFHSQYVVEAKD
jgi:hypothetical protein